MLYCIYIVYVVLCCISHSGKEERLQPIARSLNYKSNQIKSVSILASCIIKSQYYNLMKYRSCHRKHFYVCSIRLFVFNIAHTHTATSIYNACILSSCHRNEINE